MPQIEVIFDQEVKSVHSGLDEIPPSQLSHLSYSPSYIQHADMLQVKGFPDKAKNIMVGCSSISDEKISQDIVNNSLFWMFKICRSNRLEKMSGGR